MSGLLERPGFCHPPTTGVQDRRKNACNVSRFRPTVDPIPLILSLSKDELKAMAFWTYVLSRADGSYYVGHTDDLDKRMAAHHDGSLGGYTSRRRPLTLRYAEVFDTRDDAFRRERQIKGWSRVKKEALAREDWRALQRLAKTAHPSTGSG